MFRYFIAVAAISVVLWATEPVFGFEAPGCKTDESGAGCRGDCAQCHTLTTNEAETILKTERFNAKVREVRPSKVKGLWEVEIEKEKQRFIVYLDFAKQYLIDGKIVFTQISDIGKPPSLNKVDLKKIPLDDAIVMGDKNAKSKVIVFSDPDCPYCRKLHVEIKKLIEKRKDVAFLIKLYPLPMHPEAYDKSKTILCERSLKLLDDAMEGKTLAKPNCEAKAIDENIALARGLNISGTPAIIFPDGRLLPGYAEADTLLMLLEEPK